jgi:hypothetical protein
MGNLENIERRLENIEFFIEEFIKAFDDQNLNVSLLGIKKGIDKETILSIKRLCESLNNDFKKQKAEGFVIFDPLLDKLKEQLPVNLQANELIEACVNEGLATQVMYEFKRMQRKKKI